MIDDTTAKLWGQETRIETLRANITLVEMKYVSTRTTETVTKKLLDPDTMEAHQWTRTAELENPLHTYEVKIVTDEGFIIGDYYVNTENLDVMLRCVKLNVLKGTLEKPLESTISWGNEFARVGSEFKPSTKKDDSNE